MTNIEKTIQNHFQIGENNSKCYSRLFTRNIVFKINRDGKDFAVKVYYKGEDKEKRFTREIKMLEYLEKTGRLQTPNVVATDVIEGNNVLISSWMEQKSLKRLLKEKGYIECEKYIKDMLKDMEQIWSIPIEEVAFLPFEEEGIDKRLHLELEEVLETIKDKRKDISIKALEDLYYELKKKVEYTHSHVINNDISAHEYFPGSEKGYWIDFERCVIGNPNNDLARAFQSISNTFYQDKLSFDRLYDIFSKNPYFEKNAFFYYVLEKCICSLYADPYGVTLEEIETYIQWLTEKTSQKKKSL